MTLDSLLEGLLVLVVTYEKLYLNKLIFDIERLSQINLSWHTA